MEMLRNFVFEIAGCTSNFTVQSRQQSCISEIREKVDKSKVLVSDDLGGGGDQNYWIFTVGDDLTKRLKLKSWQWSVVVAQEAMTVAMVGS